MTGVKNCGSWRSYKINLWGEMCRMQVKMVLWWPVRSWAVFNRMNIHGLQWEKDGGQGVSWHTLSCGAGETSLFHACHQVFWACVSVDAPRCCATVCFPEAPVEMRAPFSKDLYTCTVRDSSCPDELTSKDTRQTKNGRGDKSMKGEVSPPGFCTRWDIGMIQWSHFYVPVYRPYSNMGSSECFL